MRALILTNGEYGDYSFCENAKAYNYITCADNGMHHSRHLGIKPNLIVGDFDSTKGTDLEYFKMQGIKIEAFATKKDETDTELALERVIAEGATEVDIYGGIGSRLDHTLANVHLLYSALVRGVKVRLMNPHNTVYLIKDTLCLTGKEGDLVSLIPFSEKVLGIDTTGLAYPLKESKMIMGQPYGVSNYMLEEIATISIKDGLLLVIKAVD